MTLDMIATREPKRAPTRRATKAAAGEAVLKIDDGAVRDVKARLARVEGQVRAVQRMLDERRDCHVVVQQLAAARTALERATAHFMVSSLTQCIRSAKNSSDEAEIQSLMATFSKML